MTSGSDDQAVDTVLDDNLVLTELIKQPYLNCTFSAGLVAGHEVDTVYLKLERTNEEPTVILLRPDEMAALLWCGSGVLWSVLLDGLGPDIERPEFSV